MAAILGLRNYLAFVAGKADWRTELERKGSVVRRVAFVVPALALLASLGSNLLWGPLLAVVEPPFREKPEPILPSAWDRTLLPYRDRLVARVPARGGVVAGWEYLARFAARDNVHPLHPLLNGFYTFSSKPYPVPRDIRALIGELDQERMVAYVNLGAGPRLRELIAANHLRAAADAGGLMLYLPDSGAAADSVELWSVGSFAIATPRRLVFEHELAYLGCELPGRVAEPGGLLPVRTYWQRLAAVDRIFVTQFVVRDDRRREVHRTWGYVGHLMNPVHLWPDSATVRTTSRILLPAELAPGHYGLGLRVITWDGHKMYARCDAPDLAANDMLFPLGEFDVTPRRNR